MSHLNRRLGPVTYEIKIKNCNITKPRADAFQAALSRSHKLSLPAQLVFFRKVTFIILFGVAQHFLFFFVLKTARTNKRSVKCHTGFSRLRPTRPIRLSFTDIHSHLLAQPQSSNFSQRFKTRATDMIKLSLSKLSKHSLFLSRNIAETTRVL